MSDSCTNVFWDVVDFPFPDGLAPETIYQNMKLVLEKLGYGGDLSIRAYVDSETLVPDKSAYEKAGITIIPHQTMSVDIVLWAMENPATFFQPRKLFVFSDNVKEGTDFYNALKALGDRYYHVQVLPPLELDVSMSSPDPIFINHMPKITKEDAVGFSNGLASLYNQVFDYCQIHVFLDVHACPTELLGILPVLRKKGYRGEVLFRPYLDMDYGHVRLGYGDGYASLRTIRVGDKSAIVTRMLLDILFWAMNNDDQPQNVMLITQPSKDTRCDFVMQALGRRGFNVIFKPSDMVASTNPHTIDSFDSLCKSLPDEKLKPWFQARKLTDQTQMLGFYSVRIYWLVDGCPSNPKEFRHKFFSTVREKGYSQCESVIAYVDKRKFSDELIKRYSQAGVGVRCIPEDDEIEKITQMSLDMTNEIVPGPLNFMVISKPFKDALFDSVVGAIEKRGCNVLFETVDYMLTFGSSHWSAKSLSD